VVGSPAQTAASATRQLADGDAGGDRRGGDQDGVIDDPVDRSRPPPLAAAGPARDAR
jgi:hypothetical protein